MNKTFDSNVWSMPMIYREAQNWTTEALRNSNEHNFSLECMIDAHQLMRQSNFINGNSRKVQMTITFDLNVWFGDVIYRDAGNWTTEVLEKLKLS